eukprot:Nitzschia sp. Nitz4//scaffold69_size99277//45172//48606//NITZ4_004631-RA/size99277-processed-gene-0.20-mRNA-1//1//CDS//3329556709//194//frame0
MARGVDSRWNFSRGGSDGADRNSGGYFDDEDDDEYSDQEMPHRARSRSLGDAEDTVLNGSPEDYEDFAVEMSMDSNGNGLHHRANTAGIHQRALPNRLRSPIPTKTPERFGYAFYRTPTPKRKSSQNTLQMPNSSSHSASSFSVSKWQWLKRHGLLRTGLCMGFAFYTIMLIRSSFWVIDSANPFPREAESQNNLYSHNFNSLATPEFVSNLLHSQERVQSRALVQQTIQERASQRRSRTIPTSMEQTSWYETSRIEDRTATLPQSFQEASGPTSLDQLCGAYARDGMQTIPERFPVDQALNGKSARVFITGILNTVGFQLAMHLYHHCGVQVIGGLDTQYPNTVENRMQMQERLQLLTTTIPKLVKPIALPFFGLDPKASEKDQASGSVGQEFDFLSWKPTHIVHVASFDHELFKDSAVDPTWRNLHSPYANDIPNDHNLLFPLRSSMVAMEQLLASVSNAPGDQRPKLVYVSTNDSSMHPKVHAASKYIDELMVETYNVPSIALKIPNAVFGPWGHPGTAVHDVVENTVAQWNGNAANTIQTLSDAPSLDLVHVDDVVDAIVGAMQYHTDHPLAFHLKPIERQSQRQLSTMLTSLTTGNQTVQKNVSPSGGNQQLLTVFEPRVPLQEGLLRTMAWHLNMHEPFGSSKESADTFLKRHGASTCSSDDWHCHKSQHYLPCLSECNTREQCLPSIFDDIQPLVYNVSEGCDYVMYTQSLGYNVQNLELQAEYMDDADLEDDEKLVCNFAFVPRDSDLVRFVAAKVPNEQLKQFGVIPQAGDTTETMKQRKLDKLNGRLLYRGWILLWVKDAVTEISHTDKSILKLSPGKLFFPKVSHAMFVEENFAASPSVEDVTFLVDEMRRRKLGKRTMKKDVVVKTPEGDVKKKKKYRLPAEPYRRATILFAPLRFPSDSKRIDIGKYKTGDKKLTVHDAAKFMWHELGNGIDDKEPDDVRRQREFYERVPSYINRNGELRSAEEPWYRYNMRHWVRSRWVVHDLTLEDSRMLRCDWFQEHVEWGTDLDQLTFAHVMAMRELKRRIAHMEPDDHIKTFIEQHPDLKGLTDSYEWHPLETELNRLHHEPVQWQSQLPDHYVDEADEVTDAAELDLHEPAPLYVRIMSERVMAASRKIWSTARKRAKKNKHPKK